MFKIIIKEKFYINFFLYDLNIQKELKFSLNNLNLTNENYILK